MDDEKNFKTVLKWAGILALIAVPVYLVLRKRKIQAEDLSPDDESNIFAAELEE